MVKIPVAMDDCGVPVGAAGMKEVVVPGSESVHEAPKLAQTFKQRSSVHVVIGSTAVALVETPGKLVKVEPTWRFEVELLDSEPGLPREGLTDRLTHSRPLHPEVVDVLSTIEGVETTDGTGTGGPLVNRLEVLVGTTGVILGRPVIVGLPEPTDDTLETDVNEIPVEVLCNETVQSGPEFTQRSKHKSSVHVVEGGLDDVVDTGPIIGVEDGKIVGVKAEDVLRMEDRIEEEIGLGKDTVQLEPSAWQTSIQSRSLQVVVGAAGDAVEDKLVIPVIDGEVGRGGVDNAVKLDELLLVGKESVQEDP